MLEGAIYFLLKKHFRGEKYYVDLLELFHDVSPISLGQHDREKGRKADDESLWGTGRSPSKLSLVSLLI